MTARNLLIADPVPKLTGARKAMLERYVGQPVSAPLFELMHMWIHQFGGSPHRPQEPSLHHKHP